MTDERKKANSNLNKAETSVLKPFLNQKGFIKRVYGSYYRVMENDLLQSIDVQKHTWQTTFTVNISVSQLYKRQLYNHLSPIIIVRLDNLCSDAYRQEYNFERFDRWFEFGGMDITAHSMGTLKLELDQFVFPFLDSVSTNRLLADFVFERTVNRKPKFIQPDATWSNYFASLLALRVEDYEAFTFFLNQAIVKAKEIKYDWGEELVKEAKILIELFEKDQTLVREYFQENTFSNIMRNRIKHG